MPRGHAAKTTTLLEAGAAILQSMQPATVRAVYYRLFVDGMIATMSKGETDRVSRILNLARERGLIPWDWIVDETRHVERLLAWSDPERFLEVVQQSYRKDWWADQPARLLVLSEKATVGGVLRPIPREYGVGLLVLQSFGSATALNDLAVISLSDACPLRLLYVGDYDPIGCYTGEVDTPTCLSRYGGCSDGHDHSGWIGGITGIMTVTSGERE